MRLRRLTEALVVIIGAVVVVEAVAEVLRVWAWRSRNPRALRLIKRFNKVVTNPLMLRFAGRSGRPAIVHHIGRRSGSHYVTPVMAHPTHRDVIVPLPYGTDVDWLRNLLAAGSGVIEIEGRHVVVGEPTVVDIDAVSGLLPTSMARTVRLNHTREALSVRTAEAIPAP